MAVTGVSRMAVVPVAERHFAIKLLLLIIVMIIVLIIVMIIVLIIVTTMMAIWSRLVSGSL